MNVSGVGGEGGGGGRRFRTAGGLVARLNRVLEGGLDEIRVRRICIKHIVVAL